MKSTKDETYMRKMLPFWYKNITTKSWTKPSLLKILHLSLEHF